MFQKLLYLDRILEIDILPSNSNDALYTQKTPTTTTHTQIYSYKVAILSLFKRGVIKLYSSSRVYNKIRKGASADVLLLSKAIIRKEACTWSRQKSPLAFRHAFHCLGRRRVLSDKDFGSLLNHFVTAVGFHRSRIASPLEFSSSVQTIESHIGIDWNCRLGVTELLIFSRANASCTTIATCGRALSRNRLTPRDSMIAYSWWLCAAFLVMSVGWSTSFACNKIESLVLGPTWTDSLSFRPHLYQPLCLQGEWERDHLLSGLCLWHQMWHLHSSCMLA